MFFIGPLFIFLIRHRFAGPTASKRERHSVCWTNLAILGIVALMGVTIGIKAFVSVHLPIVMIARAGGSVAARRARRRAWWCSRISPARRAGSSALRGSSF